MASDHRGRDVHAGKRTIDDQRWSQVTNRMSPITGKLVPREEVHTDYWDREMAPGTTHFTSRVSGDSRYGREVWPKAEVTDIHPNYLAFQKRAPRINLESGDENAEMQKVDDFYASHDENGLPIFTRMG